MALNDFLKQLTQGSSYSSPDVLSDKTKTLARRANVGAINAPRLQQNVQNLPEQQKLRITKPEPQKAKINRFNQALNTRPGRQAIQLAAGLQDVGINYNPVVAGLELGVPGGKYITKPIRKLDKKAVSVTPTPKTWDEKVARFAGEAVPAFILGGPAGVAKTAAFGGLLGAGGAVLTGQDVVEGATGGARRGVKEAQTLALTGSLVDGLANELPFFKQISSEAIKGGAPTLKMGGVQALDAAIKTVARKVVKAATVETLVESVTYGARDKEENEKLIDSIVDEIMPTLEWNVKYAVLSGAWDSRQVAPAIKNALENSPTYKATFGNQGGFIADPKRAEVEAIINQWESGAITMRQAVDKAKKIAPDITLEDINEIREGKARGQRIVQDDEWMAKNHPELGIDKSTLEMDKKVAGDARGPLIAEAEQIAISAGKGGFTDQQIERLKTIYQVLPEDQKGQVGILLDTYGIEKPSVDLTKPTDDQAKGGDTAIDRTQLTGKQLSTPTEELQKTRIQDPLPWEDGKPKVVPAEVDITPRSTDAQLTKQEVDQRVQEHYARVENESGLKRWFNDVFRPIKNASQPVQKELTDYRTRTITANVSANETAKVFMDIPEQEGWKMIQYMQEPTPAKAAELGFDPKQYQDQINGLRGYYDGIRQEGIEKGLDIKYLDNYVNQLWKESPQEIDAIVKAGAGQNPGFTKERVIPNYETGVRLGLTPRYTHPAQLAAHYRYQLDKAIANKQLVDGLIEKGALLPASQAPADWKTIDSPFFPKTSVQTGTGVIVQDYKAAPDVAKAVNNMFEVRDPGLTHLAANISKGVQNITLSGGVPGTPLNSFVLANAQKEIMAGRVRGPVVATLNSFSDGATKRYFNDNAEFVRMKAEEGIPTYESGDYRTMFRNLAESRGLKQMFGDKFNQWFNEPTFRRFMPILETEFFKDTYKQAIDNGMSPKEAQKLAGNTTKNFYSITDTFTRSGQVEDTLTALTLAPRFREAMIGFWANNLKAVNPKNIGKPEYRANQKFMVGAGIAYLMYQLMNKSLTGHWMHENKTGKELSLEIPIGDTGRSFFMPHLFTIGTVPRRVQEAGSQLLEGDIAGAAERIGTFGSIPLQTGTALLTNKTFYGAPIYKQDDPALVKLAKLAGYGIEDTAHPYLGNAISVAQGRKTPFEAVPGLLELPLYPSASTEDKNKVYEILGLSKDTAPIKIAKGNTVRVKSKKARKPSAPKTPVLKLKKPEKTVQAKFRLISPQQTSMAKILPEQDKDMPKFRIRRA